MGMTFMYVNKDHKKAMGMIRALWVLLFVLLLAGCGTLSVIDKNESDMMPRSVAMAIYEKHGFKEWAENPYLVSVSRIKCTGKKEYVEFSEIEKAEYVFSSNLFYFQLYQPVKRFQCPMLWIVFPNVTELQALELTKAARALGATKVEKLHLLKTGGLSRFFYQQP